MEMFKFKTFTTIRKMQPVLSRKKPLLRRNKVQNHKFTKNGIIGRYRLWITNLKNIFGRPLHSILGYAGWSFLLSLPIFSTKMKNDGQPIRDSVPWNSRCTKDPCWLNNVFLFSTEIWAEQLKKNHPVNLPFSF